MQFDLALGREVEQFAASNPPAHRVDDRDGVAA
jgi:hypothetical protein